MDKEIWKDIEGYEGLYQVSNLGRVKSLSNRSKHKNERVLSLQTNRKGYKYTGLCKYGSRKLKTVHRLVAKAFIPNPDSKPQVNHTDGNKTNNCVDNLEWVTASENIQHAYDNNLCLSGRNKKNAKFTNEQIAELRKDYIKGKKGYGLRTLSKKYGVAVRTIWLIINNKTYKDVK